MNKNMTIDETFKIAATNHNKNNLKEALTLYNKILEVNPNHLPSLNNVAVILSDLKEYQKAKACYKKVIEINPNYAEAHNNLGTVFLDLKEYQKAKACYNKAIEINPTYVEAHYNLGNIFNELKEYQKAKACYKKAIEINQNHIGSHNNLGNIFNELKKYQEAKACFKKIIKIDPNHTDAHYNLGNIFNELKEYQEAKKCYEKAIEINPTYADAYNNIGTILKTLDQHQEAKACFEKVIEINPNHAPAYNNLGLLLTRAGNIKTAKSYFEKVIEINPSYADSYNNLGKTFRELGDNQKAISFYEKTIKINPSHISAHNNLGYLFSEIGELQKAKFFFEKSIQINPSDEAASIGLLKTLYKMNNQSILFKELDSMIIEGKMNAVIGSICSRAEAKYGVKKENPFCNDPLNYFLKTNLTEKYDFKNVIIKCVNNILDNNFISNRTQKLITNGYQTAGNLFANIDFDTNEVQKIIHTEIEKYRLHFKNSKEGFIKNWPTNYRLYGWLINMKKGGKLSAHMHDLGWLSGSIYVNVPQKLEADSGNLVVCIADENDLVNKKNKKSIDVVTGSLCLFPSSLLHYTIPFESEENRIVLAFDVKRT